MSSRNKQEKQELEDLLLAAKDRERNSQEELDHLNLQLDILKEETSRVSPDELANNMAYQRLAHRQQLNGILKREEHRIRQMEFLEVYLTELSYLAVEIEDLLLKPSMRLFVGNAYMPRLQR